MSGEQTLKLSTDFEYVLDDFMTTNHKNFLLALVESGMYEAIYGKNCR